MGNTDLYDQLIASNKALFEDAHYEASYHILCAAKHLAIDMEDKHQLEAILEIAHQQSEWINIHAPNSILSQKSSSDRDRVNLYTSLFQQLRGEIQIVESNHIINKLNQQNSHKTPSS
jgi:hypothetical protein